jgi:hypothetical protein
VTHTLTRAAVTAVVAVTAAVAAVYYVKAVSQLDDTAGSNSSLSYDDREIAGGNSLIVDQAAAYEARALIPPHATYRFEIGTRLRESTELTKYAGDWFRYFLMPRRPDGNSQWVICYGCDTSALGASYVVRWRDEQGISIGELG